MTGLTHNGDTPSHGAKVGIGTVLETMLYEQLMPSDLSALDVEARVAALPSADAVERTVRASLPAGEVADRAVAESLAKHPTPDQLRTRLAVLRERWPAIRERIQVQLLPSTDLGRMLTELGAVSVPADLGISPARLRADLLAARTIRRRYTVLDLAAEAGLLESCVDGLIASLGPSWERGLPARPGPGDRTGGDAEGASGHHRGGQDGRAPGCAPRGAAR
jgi:glycerol-1-phosphate dehydrogenase [NAD(P)+]